MFYRHTHIHTRKETKHNTYRQKKPAPYLNIEKLPGVPVRHLTRLSHYVSSFYLVPTTSTEHRSKRRGKSKTLFHSFRCSLGRRLTLSSLYASTPPFYLLLPPVPSNVTSKTVTAKRHPICSRFVEGPPSRPRVQKPFDISPSVNILRPSFSSVPRS